MDSRTNLGLSPQRRDRNCYFGAGRAAAHWTHLGKTNSATANRNNGSKCHAQRERRPYQQNRHEQIGNTRLLLTLPSDGANQQRTGDHKRNCSTRTSNKCGDSRGERNDRRATGHQPSHRKASNKAVGHRQQNILESPGDAMHGQIETYS
jgi:hypothetical protein